MDALLLSLILCLSIEADGALAQRYTALSRAQSGMALMCMVVLAIAVAALSAVGGVWIRPMLTPEAREVFLAAALAMAGGALFFRPAPYAEESATPFMVAKLLAAGAGSSGPLIIAATRPCASAASRSRRFARLRRTASPCFLVTVNPTRTVSLL